MTQFTATDGTIITFETRPTLTSVVELFNFVYEMEMNQPPIVTLELCICGHPRHVHYSKLHDNTYKPDTYCHSVIGFNEPTICFCGKFRLKVAEAAATGATAPESVGGGLPTAGGVKDSMPYRYMD